MHYYLFIRIPFSRTFGGARVWLMLRRILVNRVKLIRNTRLSPYFFNSYGSHWKWLCRYGQELKSKSRQLVNLLEPHRRKKKCFFNKKYAKTVPRLQSIAAQFTFFFKLLLLFLFQSLRQRGFPTSWFSAEAHTDVKTIHGEYSVNAATNILAASCLARAVIA